jgi:hypothetical protein
MKTAELVACGKTIIALADRLKRQRKGKTPTERTLLAPMYGVLFGEFGKIDKEVHVKSAAWTKVKRIDFQRYGTNSVDIEFAVRTKAVTKEKSVAKANRSELLKLTRRQAPQRYLLLVDLVHGEHLDETKLNNAFKAMHAGKGKFKRRNVRVVYVHKDTDFAFTWKPKKPKPKK